MLALLEQFFIQFGYLAVFFVLILCGFGIPIPEDVTLVAGGVISGLVYTDVHIIAVVCMAGVLAGTTATACSASNPWRACSTPNVMLKYSRNLTATVTACCLLPAFCPACAAPCFSPPA